MTSASPTPLNTDVMCKPTMKPYLFVSLFVCLLLSGCSSVLRYAFDDDPRSCDMPPYIYGGVALDWLFLTGLGETSERDSGGAYIRIFGLVDLPFSIVGDTLLLPVAIPMQVSTPPCREESENT